MTRAFIIGNGPSLSKFPLERLSGEVTFACNRVNLIYGKDALSWRPTYYVASDSMNMPWPLLMRELLENVEASRHSFLCSIFANDLEKLRGYFQHPPKITYFSPCPLHQGLDIQHPNNPTTWHLPQLCTFGSVIGVSAQIAVLMGYTELYFVACDLGFDKEPTHCHPDYKMPSEAISESRDLTLQHVHSIIQRETVVHGFGVFDVGIGAIGYAQMTLDEVLD